MSDKLKKLADRLDKALDQIAFDAAQYALAIIRLRIAKGIGAEDRQMKPYTPEYAEKKQQLGRRAEIRDLTLTGRMLGGLHVAKKGPKLAAIEFADARSKVLALSNQRVDPWFGLSPQDQEKVRAYVEQRLAQLFEEK